MMWFVIGAIVIFVFAKFFWDRRKLELSIKDRGGMLIVYKELVDLLLAGHPKSKVFRESSTNITLGAVDNFTVTIFEILENFKVITITYRIKSRFFGKHMLVWEFDKMEDPEFIFFKIDSDIKAYLIRKKLLPENN